MPPRRCFECRGELKRGESWRSFADGEFHHRSKRRCDAEKRRVLLESIAHDFAEEGLDEHGNPFERRRK